MKTLFARCENGHFFDANIHKECPRCGTDTYTLTGDKPQSSSGKKEKQKADKKQYKEAKEKNKKNQHKTQQIQEAGSTLEPIMTEAATQDAKTIRSEQDAKTVKMPNSVPPTRNFTARLNPQVLAPQPPTVQLQPQTVPQLQAMSQPQAAVHYQADDTGKTVRFWEDGNEEVELVVGWIVCVKGKGAGRSYELKTGVNRIGRQTGINDIVIVEDEGISRKEHILITYEPKHGKFYMQQGEGRSLTYLNGSILLDNVEISERDRIEMGSSAFVFLPLCGDNFDWKTINYGKNTEK